MIYKSILVPLDGTKRSEAILSQVESLAQEFGATIILLEVLEAPPPHATILVPDAMKTGVEQRKSGVKQYIEELAAQLTERGFTAHPVVKYGSVVETILKVAQEQQVELIAMASHGYTGLARVLHGSVASEVLHRTRIPLLILHAEEET